MGHRCSRIGAVALLLIAASSLPELAVGATHHPAASTAGRATEQADEEGACEGFACGESDVEDLESIEGDSLRVQLLQQTVRLRQKAGPPSLEQQLSFEGERQPCPLQALFGTWEGRVDGDKVTRLEVAANADSCQKAAANFSILGLEGQYDIDVVEQVVNGTPLDAWPLALKLKFSNVKANYFHEGVFDAGSDELLEDLSYMDGKFVGGALLKWSRVASSSPTPTA